MSSTLMPTPDRPRPDLLASLPVLKAKLEDERRLLIRRLAELTARADPVLADRRAIRQDWAAANLSRTEVDSQLIGTTRQVLGDVETALNRMRTGRYGACLYCGMEIPLDRLHAVPYADSCEDCRTTS